MTSSTINRSTGFKSFQRSFYDQNPSRGPFSTLLRNYGFSRLLRLKDVKLREMLDLLAIHPRDKILDVGCGSGVLLSRLAATYQTEGVGVDISLTSLKTACLEDVHLNRYSLADGESLPFEDESFDHVLSFDLLEHLPEPEKSIWEMGRVLKPGGVLLIYVVSSKNKYTWDWWLGKVIGSYLYGRAGHAPALFLDPGKVVKEVEQGRLTVTGLVPFHSFFTLAFDEAATWASLWAERIFDKSRIGPAMGRFLLSLTTAICPPLLRLLEALDLPWRIKGYSNGFFLLAQKEERHAPAISER